jgi:hypothetical protein
MLQAARRKTAAISGRTAMQPSYGYAFPGATPSFRRRLPGRPS